MSRHELTDAQWAEIQPLVSKQSPGSGRRRADDRQTFIQIADHLLAALPGLDGGWYLGRHLAATVERTGCAQQT